MKNHEYIRRLSVKDLAKFIVRVEEVNEGDEDFDGEWVDFYVTHYVTPDGGYSYDYENAIQYTIDWLNSDYRSEVE